MIFQAPTEIFSIELLPRSVVVVRNDVADIDKFEPESGVDPAKLIFTEEDLHRAKQMRQFWQGMMASSEATENRGEEDNRYEFISPVCLI